MATRQTNEVIEHLRRAVPLRDEAGLTDGQLLGYFIEHRDDAAFAALVRRHGSMVWGVCRRLLDPHDAEDAFQATFLVLVRKAASIVSRERVANWLYGVAHQTALQARRTAARRRAREKQVTPMPEPVAMDQDPWRDLRPLLDQELSRLPTAYRAVIVLSDLEGKTRREVARQLGLPEGTVASRLARARTMLAKRLARHGLVVSGGAVACAQAAAAFAPTAVVSFTIKAARLLAAGQTAAPAVISVRVAALTEGVLQTMWRTKLKAALAVVFILGLAAAGTGIRTYGTAAGPKDDPPATEKPTPTPPKGAKLASAIEGKLKWGEPVNGLRAALAVRPVPGKAKNGDGYDLFLVVQNVSKAPLRFRDTTESPERRILDTKRDGMILDRLVFNWPTQTDVLLQPREVAFLLLIPPDRFPPNPKDGPRVGSVIADVMLKDTRYSWVAHMQIEKAPAGTWTGKLVTGATNGAAEDMKSDLPLATGKK